MKLSIQQFLIDSKELHFLFDQSHHPAIEVEGNYYHSLNSLVKILPQLLEPRNIEKLAQIVNFLAKGLEFHYIENIEQFKESYQEQIDSELMTMDNDYSRLRDYGIYDLSCMHSPRLLDEKLVFFVKHDYLSIPYQVTLYFPLRANSVHMSYELLPMK